MNLLIYFAEVAGAVVAVTTAFSVLYIKLIKPAKNVLDDLNKNKEKTLELKADIDKINQNIEEQNDYDTENRAIVMNSLIAILDGLEQQGANGRVKTTKKDLISYMAKNLNGKK